MNQRKYKRRNKDPNRDILKDLASLPVLSESDPIFSVTSESSILGLLERRREQRLTEKEAQYIFLLSHGWNYKKISHELNVSYDSVRMHMQNARAVLQANNNEHLIGLALRAGLID